MVALVSDSPCAPPPLAGLDAAKQAGSEGDVRAVVVGLHGGDTLDRFTPGDVVEVVAVTGADAVARRLVDLGFWAGSRVTVVRRAPLADPTVYWLCGYRLALRRGEAMRVVVRAARP
jgi:Fe2+ transport system protein FeoA